MKFVLPGWSAIIRGFSDGLRWSCSIFTEEIIGEANYIPYSLSNWWIVHFTQNVKTD